MDTSRQAEDIDDQDDLITGNNILQSPSEASSYTSQTEVARSATSFKGTEEEQTGFKPTSFVFTSQSLNHQDQLSDCSSEQDQLFIDSGENNLVSNQPSRTPSISSLSDQLSPSGLSSNISTSKVHRRGKKVNVYFVSYFDFDDWRVISLVWKTNIIFEFSAKRSVNLKYSVCCIFDNISSSFFVSEILLTFLTSYLECISSFKKSFFVFP